MRKKERKNYPASWEELIKNIRLSQEVSVENKKRKYTEKELERFLNVSADLVAIIGKDIYIKKAKKRTLKFAFSPKWIIFKILYAPT